MDHYLLSQSFVRCAKKTPIPDLIVCSLPTIELSFEAVKFGMLHNIPVIIDVRDLWPDIFVEKLPNILQPVARTMLYPLFSQTKRSLSQCSALIAVSDGYLKWGLDISGRKKTVLDRVFPLCYQGEECPDHEVDKAGKKLVDDGLDISKEIVWFVGSFGDTYDLSTVIRGARMALQQSWQTPLFVFSGSGDNDERWRNEALGLPNVFFTGWVDTPKSRFLMRHSKIGLLAYALDAPQGLPNKLYEYLFAGLPILSSLQREMPDFLENSQCGLTYQAGDPLDFLQKLRALMDDEKFRCRMADNARRLYQEKFSTDTVFSDMIRLLGS